MNKVIEWAKQSRLHIPVVLLFFIEFISIQVGASILSMIVLSISLILGVSLGAPHLLTVISQIMLFVTCVFWLFIIEKRDFSTFQMKKFPLQYTKGFIGGTIAVSLLSIITVILFHEGSYISTLNIAIPNILMVLGWLIIFVIQGAGEELLVRAIMMPTLGRKIGVYPSVIITSLIFSLLHLANPSFDVISMINTFLIGCIFGMMVYYYDSFWQVCAAHSAWNFFMGCIYGIEVSGLDKMPSLFQSNIVGPSLLTGGAYGIEASIITSIVGVVVLVYYVKLYEKKKNMNVNL